MAISIVKSWFGGMTCASYRTQESDSLEFSQAETNPNEGQAATHIEVLGVDKLGRRSRVGRSDDAHRNRVARARLDWGRASRAVSASFQHCRQWLCRLTLVPVRKRLRATGKGVKTQRFVLESHSAIAKTHQIVAGQAKVDIVVRARQARREFCRVRGGKGRAPDFQQSANCGTKGSNDRLQAPRLTATVTPVGRKSVCDLTRVEEQVLLRVAHVGDAVRQARSAVDALLADPLRARVCEGKIVSVSVTPALECVYRPAPRPSWSEPLWPNQASGGERLTLTLTGRAARVQVRVLDLAQGLTEEPVVATASTSTSASDEGRVYCGGRAVEVCAGRQESVSLRQIIHEYIAFGLQERAWKVMHAYEDNASRLTLVRPREQSRVAIARGSQSSSRGDAVSRNERAGSNERKSNSSGRGVQERREAHRGSWRGGKARERERGGEEDDRRLEIGNKGRGTSGDTRPSSRVSR